MSGTMVVSLDFELMWGVLDKKNVTTYGQNIRNGKKCIFSILSLFEKYGIHATWGIVGFMYFKNFHDLEMNLPEKKPLYKKDCLSPYLHLNAIKEQNTVYYFAENVINEISCHSGQEIATHTFSHFYCKEIGQDEHSFEADLSAAVKTASEHGYQTQSIIFPRNQLNNNYIHILQKHNITNYRGNDKGYFYQPRNTEENGYLLRGVRLADTYFNLSGFQCYKYEEIPQNGLNNIRSSRFLRPYNKKLFFLEPMKLHRIKMQMKHAAKYGKIFHIWWHPHNFGENTDKNLEMLEELLKYFSNLKRRYGFQSLNMQELGDICNADLNVSRKRKK